MVHYNITMRHTEATLEKLAHMQYDLFCRSNRIARTVISFAALGCGIFNYQKWWGVLLIFYGSYLGSSKYASANHTARKIARQIKEADMELPASRYIFRDTAMEVMTLPENTSLGDPLVYSEICRMGEDANYFYLFRNQYGGYMLPKEELGDDIERFRLFMQEKSGQKFCVQMAPVLRMLHRIPGRQNGK